MTRWFLALQTRLRLLFGRASAESRMDEEFRFHVEMTAEANERAGMSPKEAWRRALVAFGGIERHKETMREERGARLLDNAARDARHALRRLRFQPLSVLTAVGLLALAIGLTTATFTILDSLVIRPVPFPGADRLARVSMFGPSGGRYAVSRAVYGAWRDSRVFEDVEAMATADALIESDRGLVTRDCAYVSAGLFPMLGARPMRGRLFLPDEGGAGTDEAVIISETLWRSWFGADASILGRRIRVDGTDLAVVGVLPSGFRFPSWNTALWRPLDFMTPSPALDDQPPQAIALWAEGIPQQDALRVASEAAHAADPSTTDLSAFPSPLSGPQPNDSLLRAAPLFAAGVMLVFLILCVNVGGLLLVHLTARRRELSVRAALGASHSRLLSEALMESLLLGLLGGAAGIAVALGLVQIARALLPQAVLLRTLNPLSIDLRALAFALSTGVLATAIAGFLPAWTTTRADPARALRVTERGGTDSSRARKVSGLLLVTQFALACTLLLGATLLVGSYVNMLRADRGLDTNGVVTAWVTGLPGSEEERSIRATAGMGIQHAIESIPGVLAVTPSFGTPPEGGAIHFGDGWVSDVEGAQRLRMVVDSYEVGPDFFRLYDIPILMGRTFRPGDDGSQVIVGERLAEAFWPGLDPVGHSFRYESRRYEVIGLARETNLPSIEAMVDRPEFYQPFTYGGRQFMLNIRMGAGARPDLAAIRARILEASPGVRVVDVSLLEREYLEQTARPRASAALAFVFAAIALLATAGGLFATLNQAVSRRRREFGIRIALGARSSEVRRLVLVDGIRTAFFGLLIGGVAGWWLSRALTSMTYGVSATAIPVWGIVAGIVVLTSLAASWRPARKAARLDPAALLREE